MLNETALSVKSYVEKNKKSVFIIVIFVLGILLLVFSSSHFSEENVTVENEDLNSYKERLEAELSEVCSSVKGVGRCKVTVTFERGEERVYKGSSLIESRPPKVLGVTVVCKGADSDSVRAEIVDMMSALFDIGANRIAVLKLNS